MSSPIDLMNSWRVALSMPGLALRSSIGQTDAAAIKIESGTGAPTHTAVSGSLYIRTDATDSGTWVYRNTDGATTWEAALDTEATELLASANTWASLQTLTTGARVVDTGAIQFGTAGADLVLTADGTDVVVTGTGDLVIADSLDFAIGTGKDVIFTSGGTDVTVSGTGDLVLADSFDFYIGTDKNVGFVSDGTDVTVSGSGDLVFADSLDVAWGAGKDLILTSDGTDVNATGAGIFRMADNKQLAFGAGNDLIVKSDGTNVAFLAGTDDTVWSIGDGTANFDVKTFGNIATAFMSWDASLSELSFSGPVRLSKMNCLSRRFELKHVAGQRGKPGVNGDIQAADEATRMVADPDFEILGTNCVSSCSAYNAEGGLTLTTTAGANDQVILAPHLDANQSPWTGVTWGTDRETIWECMIRTRAGIAATIIWAGLKLTNTSTSATDADEVFFRYENGVNTGKWQAVSNGAGGLVETDAGVVVATTTNYHLKIVVGSDRVARYYINGVLVHTLAAALDDTVDLIPYIGVQGNAQAIDYFGQSIGREFPA